MTTLGKTTAGTTTTTSSGNKTVVSPVIPDSDGTVTGGHLRAKVDTGTVTARIVIYADSSGTPGAKLAESDAISITATTSAWQDGTFSGANQVTLTAGTQYWIGAAWPDPGSNSIIYERDNDSGQRREQTADRPNPFGTPSLTSGGPIAVYVDYSAAAPPGGGGGTPGSVFDLSKVHLTLPTDGGDAGTDADQIDQPALNTYSDANFYLDSSNQMVMVAPVQGATTSSASGATRCEFREENPGGVDYDLASVGYRRLTVTALWDPTSCTDRKEMIVGQVHGTTGTPPLYLAAEYHVATPRLRVYKDGPGLANILTGLTTTTPVTYRIEITGGRVKLWAAIGQVSDLPATPQFDWAASEFADNTGCYLKDGAYNKSSIANGGTGESVTTVIYRELLQAPSTGQTIVAGTVAGTDPQPSPAIGTSVALGTVAGTDPQPAPQVNPGPVFVNLAAAPAPAVPPGPKLVQIIQPGTVPPPDVPPLEFVTGASRPPLRVDFWALDDDNQTLLAPLPQPVAWDISLIPGQPGAVKLEYPRDGINFDILDERVSRTRDLHIRIRTDGTDSSALGALLFARDGDDIAESSTVTFTGSFLTCRLREARIRYNTANAKGETAFSAATAGAIMRYLMQAAQARGTLTDLHWTFDDTYDSNGIRWPADGRVSATFSPGKDYLGVAQQLRTWGMAEFEVTTQLELKLYVPNTVGTDHTVADPPLVLRRGRDLMTAPHRLDLSAAYTDLEVAGKDGVYVATHDATARAARGRQIESYDSEGNLADTGSAMAYAQTVLARDVYPPEELDYELTFAQDLPCPLREIMPSDWCYADTGSGLTSRERVAQLTISMRAGQDRLTGGVVLRDLLAERDIQLQRQIDALKSGSSVVGTSAGSSTADTVAPAAPTGLVVNSTAYSAGPVTYAALICDWDDVTLNEPAPTSDKNRAAQLILKRIESGEPILEDWTWSGAPDLVRQYNDELITDYEAAHGGTYNYPADIDNGTVSSWLAGLVASDSVVTAATDIDHYRIEFGYGVQPAVFEFGAEPKTSFGTVGAVQAGVVVSVRVFAVDRDGNTSAPSGLVTITTSADNIPPPTPSTPTVTNYLGVLLCGWDGLGSAGEAMPVDFDHVEVHMSTSAVFTPDATTLQGSIYAAGTFPVADGLTYGTTYYFRFVAVDTAYPTPNASPPSATGSGIPEQVVSADVFDGAIGSAKLADAAIVTAKIADLAVNDAKIGSLSVGKLTAGTFSAAMTLSGIIRTSTSGPRFEADAAGIRLYNAAGTRTVDLQTDDGSALVTGTFRSALSGERLEINPSEGQADVIAVYPSGSGSFATIAARTAPADGSGAILIDGGATSGSGRGRLGAYKSEAFISYAINDSAGDTQTGFSRTAVSCGASVINMWCQDRILFSKYSGSNILPNSGGWIMWASGSMSNCPVIGGNLQDSAVKFDEGTTCATNAIGTLFGPMKASAFITSSSLAAKTDVQDLRRVLTPLDVIARARSRAYRYRDEIQARGDRAPLRVGPLAEDLPAELVDYTPAAAGGLEPSVDLGRQVGVLWAAIGQLLDQRITSTTGVCVVPAGTRIAPGAMVEVVCGWESSPLAAPTDALVFVQPGHAGRVTAWVKPGSVDGAGCTVVFKNISAAPVVAAAGGPAATVVGQALYTPPIGATT